MIVQVPRPLASWRRRVIAASLVAAFALSSATTAASARTSATKNSPRVVTTTKEVRSTKKTVRGRGTSTVVARYTLQPTTTCVPERVAMDFLPSRPLEASVAGSQAAVVATVVSTSAARWNSPDGRQWSSRLGAPHRYHTAVINVTTSIYGDTPGTLTLLLAGAGLGAPPPDYCIGIDHTDNAAYSSLVAGTKAVILLTESYFVMSDGGRVYGWMPSDNYAVWVIQGGRAVNRDEKKTMTVDDLLDKLRFERSPSKPTTP